jgi:hypothetical protein
VQVRVGGSAGPEARYPRQSASGRRKRGFALPPARGAGPEALRRSRGCSAAHGGRQKSPPAFLAKLNCCIQLLLNWTHTDYCAVSKRLKTWAGAPNTSIFGVLFRKVKEILRFCCLPAGAPRGTQEHQRAPRGHAAGPRRRTRLRNTAAPGRAGRENSAPKLKSPQGQAGGREKKSLRISLGAAKGFEKNKRGRRQSARLRLWKAIGSCAGPAFAGPAQHLPAFRGKCLETGEIVAARVAMRC